MNRKPGNYYPKSKQKELVKMKSRQMVSVAGSFWNSSRTSQKSKNSSGYVMTYQNYFLNAVKRQTFMFTARFLVSINLDVSHFLLRNHPKPTRRTRNKMQIPYLMNLENQQNPKSVHKQKAYPK